MGATNARMYTWIKKHKNGSNESAQTRSWKRKWASEFWKPKGRGRETEEASEWNRRMEERVSECK